MDSVFLKIWQFSPHLLIVEKLDVFNFHRIFFLLLSLMTHSRARFKHVFLKIYIKSEQDFKRFLIFLNIKMLAKSNKIELSEEFTVMWREEQTLWIVMSPSYWDKNEKHKSFRSNHRRWFQRRIHKNLPHSFN